MKAVLGEVLEGPAGSATEVRFEGDRPTSDQEATLATWFLRCPSQSPFWDRYVLSTIHLREIPNVRPPVLREPNATHEVLVVALDPDSNPRPDDVATWKFLTPINVEEQVELPDDESAVRLLRRCAEAVVAGVLFAEPPLSGQREPWRTSLVKTAAHYRGEEHAP